MFDILLSSYLWLKALHIIAVISWMAGLLYLPRIFVYHCQVEKGSNQDKTLQIMEAKLLRVIMNPAMVATLVFGLALMLVPGIVSHEDVWLSLKLILVILMVVFHMALARWRRLFSEGSNEKTESFYRKANEIPTALMVLIVVLVVVRPF